MHLPLALSPQTLNPKPLNNAAVRMLYHAAIVKASGNVDDERQ